MNGLNKLLQLNCALSLMWGASAFAVDGVLEINHACATQLGCFSGDSVGYPITIDGSAGGSYRLTSDLVLPNENTSGITVTADDVTIDLNGFAITGPTTCVGSVPPVCTPLGNGSGILASANNLSVSNGTIRGMGNHCVKPGNFSMIHHLHLRHCGGDGITLGSVSIITNNTVSSVGGDGIRSDQAVIRTNLINGTAGDGIHATGQSIVESNVVFFAGQDGANGLNMATLTGYLHNTVSQTSGPVTGGTEMGVNICGGNTTCP
jgi:hypothetical protein